MKLYPPGARIEGRYRVTSRPMFGGMGIVYLCHDLAEDRPVALKTFRPEYLPDRAARDRFLLEGTHWVGLGAHPHVVRCYQVIRVGDGSEVYLALELVAKEQGRADASLRSWLMPGRPLPTEMALLFALQIARGMAHAAATIPGLVHRDLKPENVLVGSDRLSDGSTNRLRITDLGLAKVLEAVSSKQQTARDKASAIGSELPPSDRLGRTQLTRGIVGTPLYMAPEQWRGEPVTAATDIYALGCILVEMVAGQRAVDGGSLVALERAHCTGQVRPLPTGIPKAVHEVVDRCLVLKPLARYGSWAEVKAGLEAAFRALSGQPALDPEPTAPQGRAERVAAGWSYSEMGYSYLDLGQAQAALGYFERARAAGAAEGERRLEAAGLNHLGAAYDDLGDARHAVDYYEQALTILREIDDRRSTSAVLDNLGTAYTHLGNASRAISYYEPALTILREIGDRRGEGNILGNLGLAYAGLGDAHRAISCHEQALAILREIGDRRGLSAALGNLGTAYADLGDARRAIGYYEQYLAIAREIGDQRREGNALGNLGTAYAELGDARRAAGYFEQALAIHHELNDRREEGTDLGNLGSAYLQLGNARRAIDYHKQQLVIAHEIGDVMGLAIGSFNLADGYRKLGETGRAVQLAQQAAHLFAQIGHAGHARRALQLVSRLQGSEMADDDPLPARFLAHFGPLIDAVVAGAQGNRQARAVMQVVFDQLEQGSKGIVNPIQRIWDGERDEATLTAGINANSALIVREILKRLKS